MSILYGSAYGVLRVMYGNPDKKAGLVPVDYCANMMLACAWHTATNVKQMWVNWLLNYILIIFIKF